MTKQEEIMARSHQLIEENPHIDEGKAWLTFEGLRLLFKYLHSVGVVIKVDKPFGITGAINETGLGTFESLI